MLTVRGEEVVDPIISQGVIVIIGALGVQRRHNGLQAGVGNGAGGKSLVQVGVIGAIYCLIIFLANNFPFGQHILNGGINL